MQHTFVMLQGGQQRAVSTKITLVSLSSHKVVCQRFVLVTEGTFT